MDDADRYLAAHYQSLGSLDNDFRNANLIQLVADSVVGERVLDIGCGSGGLLRVLAARGKTVCGLEPNADLVSLSARLYPALHVTHGDGGCLDRVPGPFDAITIIDVLEHIEDDRAQLRAMWQHLTPGGQLVIIVPCSPVLYGHRDRGQGHFRRYIAQELTEKLRTAGFEVLSTRYWNAIGWWPYFLAERVFGRALQVGLRTSRPKSVLERLAIRVFHAWFRAVERHISFGFGLSLMCIARKPAAETVATRRAA
jgi:SAM-dependent methyltransferase